MPPHQPAGVPSRRRRQIDPQSTRDHAQVTDTAGPDASGESAAQQLARALTPLIALGHHLLPDRSWPGGGREHADLLVIGPGGVFVLAAQHWPEVSIDADRVWHGRADVTGAVMGLADLAYRAEAVFAEVGLAPGEVRPVVVLLGRGGVDQQVGPVRLIGADDAVQHIAGYGDRLTAAQVELVLTHARDQFRTVGDPQRVAVVGPAVPAPRDPPSPPLGAALVGAAPTAGPVEPWMSFLHPAQAQLVRRSFSGPARIRGAAGTGKTVVALHRAAYLARTRPGTVLVTTFVRALPEVMRAELTGLAPDVADRIELTRVQDWARALLAERGVPVLLDARAAAEAFDAAWRSLPPAGWLARTDRDHAYWKDEISHVIKGRGLTSFDDYAQLPRTGRRQRLDLDRRREVWALYVAYQAELAARHAHDFDDVVLLAEAELARTPLTGRYASVIVDEAQDLSVVMVRMLHRLVGDVPDGLTLVSDGQQCLYPGGCTLAEAGVQIAGRAVVLDVNYRNTAQILTFAQRLVEGDELADLDGPTAPGDQPRAVPRSGPEPVLARFRSPAARDRATIDRLRTLIEEQATAPGQIGVLCGSRRAAERVGALLRSAGLPTELFEEHDGVPVDVVQVGTIKRAKGLEFGQVLLPDVRPEQLDAAPTDPVGHERWELSRRELYVAMTRARDGLWVAVL